MLVTTHTHIYYKTQRLRTKQDQPGVTKIVPNLFRYNIDSNIKHDLLWNTTGPLANEKIEEILNEYFKNSNYEYVWWENAPQNKSIPELWHIQIVSYPKQ